MELLKIVICFLSFSFVYCQTGSYRAAVVESIVSNENKLKSIIYEAAVLNVDILMLPQISTNKVEEIISNAAKEAKLYIAVQTVEPSDGDTRNNLIFDRNGEIVQKAVANKSPAMETFTPDFGVTFGVVSEEDLLVAEHLEVRNIIAFGPSINDTRLLYAKQFPSSWAFTTRSNLITASGIYGGATVKNGGLVVVEIKSDLPDTFNVEPAKSYFLTEDVSQYTSEQLRMSAGRQYKKTVCHDHFCCDFTAKASKAGEIPFTLVAHNGVQDVGASTIGLQVCAITQLESNSSSTVFEKLSISAHFSENSVQYPLIISSIEASYEDVKFHVQRNETNHASIELKNRDIVSCGILGRVAKDTGRSNGDVNLADIAVENLQEVFDYVWVRLRVLIFIASIYVLEMM